MISEQTLTPSEVDNSALLQKILKVLENDKDKEYMFFNNILNVLESLNDVKLYEDNESSLSCCLSELISDNKTDMALKLLTHTNLEDCESSLSYNIFTGVMGSRSDASIDGVVTIINNLIAKGLKVDCSSIDKKTVLEYAAEQFLYSVSEYSDKSNKVIDGDRRILLTIIDHQPIAESEKEYLRNEIEKLNDRKITTEERETIFQMFQSQNTNETTILESLDNDMETSVQFSSNDDDIENEFLPQDLRQKPVRKENFLRYLLGITKSPKIHHDNTTDSTSQSSDRSSSLISIHLDSPTASPQTTNTKSNTDPLKTPNSSSLGK